MSIESKLCRMYEDGVITRIRQESNKLLVDFKKDDSELNLIFNTDSSSLLINDALLDGNDITGSIQCANLVHYKNKFLKKIHNTLNDLFGVYLHNELDEIVHNIIEYGRVTKICFHYNALQILQRGLVFDIWVKTSGSSPDYPAPENITLGISLDMTSMIIFVDSTGEKHELNYEHRNRLHRFIAKQLCVENKEFTQSVDCIIQHAKDLTS